MHIVVPIKQVPETNEVKMDEETGTMIRAGVMSIVNPLDLYAIEEALMLRETHGGLVTVISMGPSSALTAIKEAISMGCDEGYLLTDRRFAGSDTWATAHVLAQAIRKLGPFDLVVCGERATDGDTGQVGPEIAAFLDVPILTYVAGLRIEDDAAVVRRLVETGYERYRCPLPLVITVVKEIAYPRLPTLRGKQRAKRMSVPEWDNAVLQLDEGSIGLAGSPTRVKRISRPKVSREGERLVVKTEQDVSAAVDRIIQYLDHQHLL
jgi:electron transfer flavoprotein beta subunit